MSKRSFTYAYKPTNIPWLYERIESVKKLFVDIKNQSASSEEPNRTQQLLINWQTETKNHIDMLQSLAPVEFNESLANLIVIALSQTWGTYIVDEKVRTVEKALEYIQSLLKCEIITKEWYNASGEDDSRFRYLLQWPDPPHRPLRGNVPEEMLRDFELVIRREKGRVSYSEELEKEASDRLSELRMLQVQTGVVVSESNSRLDVESQSIEAMMSIILPQKQNAAQKESQNLVRDTKLEERDKWIYEQCCTGKPYNKIKAVLKKLAVENSWTIIASIPGIRKAASKYAERHQMPPPASRHNK